MINSLIRSCTYTTTILFMVLAHVVAADIPIDLTGTQESSDLGFTGDFSGYIFMEDGTEKKNVGLIVTDLGDNEYQAVLYFGGLPGEQGDSAAEARTVELSGTYSDYTLRLTGDFPLEFQFIHGRFTALDDMNSYMGHLERVIRVDVNS